jgi:hypothetical protein
MTQSPLSRRRFLKETLFGVAILSAARLMPSTLLFAQEGAVAGRRLRFFSDEEFLIVQAIAARMIGVAEQGHGGADGIDVAARADQFLSTADTEIREQFHLLLTVFNSAFFAFLFDFRFSSFLGMSAGSQDSYLEDWMTSHLGFRRTGFQGLKRLCMSMYYTDSRSWGEIGYQAVTVPEERR